MKTMLKIKLLPLLTAGLGVLTLMARLALFLLGTDEKNLLICGHPLDILIWTVTAAAAILICALVCRLDGSAKYADNFSPSSAAAIGAFALAGGITVFVLTGWSLWPRLDLLCNVCGLIAVPALILAGLRRWQGRQPFFGGHAVVCLYLTLYAITHYQIWSSRPQIQDWFFSMAAILSLALFAYYQTAFDASMGSRRMQLGTGLLAGFFCLAAIAGGEDVLLYLGGALWALTNLCSLFPVPRRRKNPITQSRGDSSDASVCRPE